MTDSPEEEQVAEDEEDQERDDQTVITVPTELLPAIRQLIAAHQTT